MNPLLWPFQESGVAWLTRRKFGLLADEMGLGKSVQVIHAADEIIATRVLVICPAIAREHWAREWRRWQRLERPVVLVEKTAERVWDAEGVVIVSYEFAIRSRPALWGPWHLLIIDEAHACKDPATERAQAVLGRPGGLIDRAERCWALTGTPIMNHAGEIWPMAMAFGATQLPYSQWCRRTCNVKRNRYSGRVRIFGTKPAEYIREEVGAVLGAFTLRRTKGEVGVQLPDILIYERVVEAGPVDLELARSLASYVSDRQGFEIELEQQAMLVKTLIGPGIGPDTIRALAAMVPSITTLLRYTGLQKSDPIADLVRDEIGRGAYAKLVVFFRYHDLGECLLARLRHFNIRTWYLPPQGPRRQKTIDEWSSARGPSVFLAQLDAASVAIDLTAAAEAIVAEASFVPAINAQAVARLHRLTQKAKKVRARFISIAGSYDEIVTQAVIRKSADIAAILQHAKERAWPSLAQK